MIIKIEDLPPKTKIKRIKFDIILEGSEGTTEETPEETPKETPEVRKEKIAPEMLDIEF